MFYRLLNAKHPFELFVPQVLFTDKAMLRNSDRMHDNIKGEPFWRGFRCYNSTKAALVQKMHTTFAISRRLDEEFCHFSQWEDFPALEEINTLQSSDSHFSITVSLANMTDFIHQRRAIIRYFTCH